jgi:hypothetical protein
VALACNPNYLRGRDWEDYGGRQNIAKPHINQLLGMVDCGCHSSYKGSINRGIVVQASSDINKRSCLNNNQNMAKVEEHLLVSMTLSVQTPVLPKNKRL